MAKHERPPDYPNKPLRSFICSSSHARYAKICEAFLSNFPSQKVWRTQYPEGEKQTVWYAGFDYAFNYEEERYILNFDIRDNDIIIEFRKPQYLKNRLSVPFSRQGNWEKVEFNKCNEKDLIKATSDYIGESKIAFDIDRTKFRSWVCKCKDKENH